MLGIVVVSVIYAVVFLAFYSERTVGGRHGYPLARAAWRTLAAAAARGDRAAIEAVWQAWLRHPDDERWDLLCQCRGAREMAEAVFAAATDPARPARAVVDPGSGRLAILGYGVDLYAPFGEQVIAREWSSTGCMCFLGPGRFVAERFGTLQMWHLLGGRLVRQPMRRRVPPGHGVTAMVAVPQRGELAVLLYKGNWWESNRFVRYFDAQTLTEVEGQHGLAGKTGHALWSSPRGSTHALASDGSLDIAFTTHPLAPLVDRPMGGMTSSDLVAVAGSLGRHDQFPAERPALELLRACLEYRFGADVAIGPTRTMAGGADEIGLSQD